MGSPPAHGSLLRHGYPKTLSGAPSDLPRDPALLERVFLADHQFHVILGLLHGFLVLLCYPDGQDGVVDGLDALCPQVQILSLLPEGRRKGKIDLGTVGVAFWPC